MEFPKLELRPESGVLWKFFEGFRLLRADVAADGGFAPGDLVVAHHPDPEVEPLHYRVKRAFQRSDNGLWCVAAVLTSKVPRWDKRETPKTHDYTASTVGWGHDLVLKLRNSGLALAQGWGVGLRDGDFIVVSSPRPATYTIVALEYETDPADMWKATLKEIVHGR